VRRGWYRSTIFTGGYATRKQPMGYGRLRRLSVIGLSALRRNLESPHLAENCILVLKFGVTPKAASHVFPE
jgi:hypothetical protein